MIRILVRKLLINNNNLLKLFWNNDGEIKAVFFFSTLTGNEQSALALGVSASSYFFETLTQTAQWRYAGTLAGWLGTDMYCKYLYHGYVHCQE